MVKITDSIQKVPNIGPKYKNLLNTLDINTVEDLLYYFPFRYEDLSNIKKIKDIEAGEIVTIKGLLTPLNNIFTKYGKKLTKAKVLDFSGEVDIVWFNQHFLKKTLKTGQEYFFSGKVELFDRKLCLISPEIEEVKEKNINTGRLVPIYPETAGLSSKWIRARINDLLTNDLDLMDIHEYLPQNILLNFTFKDINWCFKNIHFPESKVFAEQAIKRFTFEELFLELLNVEQKKHSWKENIQGLRLKSYDNEIQEFIRALPFTLTDSQIEAVKKINEKMSIEHPMNMLLEGDVGSGKTVIAVISAYKAYLNNFKTLYMAPTEILANQHYESFKKFMGNYDVIVELSTGNNKVKNENWNILIGTHALLHNKELYERIGLVIIDEQHRFGVEQRGKIVEMTKDKHKPHFLSMTATPIPRTLALTIYGDLDITALKEHPNKNRDITTKIVSQKQRNEAYQWIKERNVSTFIVCPFIEKSESENLSNIKAAQKEFEELKNTVFKETTVGLLHGKMKSQEKDEVIKKFKSGEIKVLVSTPVIEVGVDIPDAEIIVIESAERYGLASLHQLRGRVGRGQNKGYCFAIMSSYSKYAYERLKHLEKVNNGLELAEIDMKMRGHGDVFGTIQHGFKKFRLASLDNVELIENAKIAAQDTFKTLDQHENLKRKLQHKNSIYVKNN